MYPWLIFEQFCKQQYKHTCVRVEALVARLYMALTCSTKHSSI